MVKLKNEERVKCEVWSRVMGYHRPVSGWNIGKQQEFKDRLYFKEPKPTKEEPPNDLRHKQPAMQNR